MLTRIGAALAVLLSLFFSLETFGAVGRVAGQFNVSRTGSAQYAIPIFAPPGPRGIQPALALVYDSQQTIGPLGVGWSLTGLGSITRCNLTAAQDSAPAPVDLVSSDGYCLNGNRIRLTSAAGTYGQAGSTYQTEVADFSNITAYSSAGITGIGYFVVQARNGLTYYYGFTDGNGNGAGSAALASGTSTVLTWFLSKVVDRSGTNNYVINYTAQEGTAVPSKILWTPTSAESTSYAYQMVFNYNPNVTQGSIYEYVAGTVVNNTQLLSSIEIYSGSTVVKDYFLAYQLSPVTGREELYSVTNCADSAQSNCLAPTKITYQNGTPGLSSSTETAASATGPNLTTHYDLNGDGYPDLVYGSGNSCQVAFGSGSGYSAAINIGFCPVVIGNLTGSHEDGMLAVSSGVFWYYTWNGTSFTGINTGVAYDANTAGYQLADINGDGLPDLIDLDVVFGQSGSATIYTRLNTSTGGVISFSSTTTLAYTTEASSAQLQTPDMQNGKLRRFDFNGDGRDDLVLSVIPHATGRGGLMYTYALVSTSTGFTASLLLSESPALSYRPVYFINWNDDKCTDFVTSGTLFVAACNGAVAQSYPLSGSVVQALDWNDDGRTDLVVSNGSTLSVYLSQGNGAPTLTTTTTPYNYNCSYVWMDANGDGLDDLGCQSTAAPYALTYYVNDGTTDLANSFTDGYGNNVTPTYLPLSQANYTAGSGAYPDIPFDGYLVLVNKAQFSDPSSASGGTYSFSYAYGDALTNVEGRGFDGFGSVTATDNRTNGLVYVSNYQFVFPYTGMQSAQSVTQSKSNGSAGVSSATGTPASTTLSTTQYQERYFPYFSNWTVTQYEVGGPENGDPVTGTSTEFTYDNYGNATSIVKVVRDEDANSPYYEYTWTTTTTNTTDISVEQSADLAAWCLNMLDATQVVYSSTLPGSTAVTRMKNFTPDTPAACRIKLTITEPTSNSGLYKVTEGLTFDSFGNVASDAITGANMPNSPATRVTTLNWGTTGQFLTTSTDPSNATTNWTYASAQSLTFGVPDSVKNANNLTTSWGYDSFGRKDKETRADGTSTAWTWSACTAQCGWSNSVYQVAQTLYQTNGTTAIRTDTTSFDPIDRVTQTAGPTVSGGTATVQELYNSFGLLAQQSMPFLSGTPYQQSYSYDPLNRLVETERPVSASSGQTYCNPATVPPISGCQGTSYAYTGRKVKVTDPLGNTKTTIFDVNGWLRQTQDALGYKITRAFDSAGSLLGVTDSVGNTLLSGVSYAYGIKPFRLAATDADRGAWSYTVDSLGERISWKDAKSQSFSMTFDALSRPLTRTEPDLFTQWQYGSSPGNFNVGQLISECTGTGTVCVSSTGYSEARTFDSTGRLATRSITEGGNPGNNTGGTFLFTYAYSPATGFLNTLTYPISTSSVALTLQYGYQNGILQTVTDTTDTTSTCGTTCTLWTANTANAFGEITKGTLGNGVVANRSFDAVTSWLSAATAGVGGGSALLNQSYLEDEDGNITQRQNNNLGLTESFAYDAENRLTCVALASTCTSQTMVYDGGSAGPGNITTQNGLGIYTYPAPGQARPHAVTSLAGTLNGIKDPSFSYDANGNMTNRASSTQNVYWSSYNYPISISGSDATGSEEVQFSYGPDRQRWKQIYTGPSGTETTYYVGKNLEVVFNGATNYRHYIYAGSEPVAIYNRTSGGAVTMSYTLEDHQGGLSSITSNSGTVGGTSGVDESFTAFGQRRNPETWYGAPTTGDLNTIAGLSRQGYTWQTWLGQSMGLNHMNGRVQDAILGRFLSPDPHIPDPTSAQSYNRYSYVNNNPLSATDPSGFSPCTGTAHGSGCYAGGRGFRFDPDWGMFGQSMLDYDSGDVGYSGSMLESMLDDSGDVGYSGGDGGDGSDQGDTSSSGNISESAANDESSAQSQTSPSQTSSDGLQEIVVTAQSTASRVYPVENPGWDLVGLDFVQGIMSSGAQFMSHIRPRHASNAAYPQSPLNGRFAASILSLSTTPDQFDSELGLLFNQYTPAYWGPTAAGLALEFVLPGPVGTDFSNTPTNSWTVVLAPAGSGVFQVWTTYPGHPVPND